MTKNRPIFIEGDPAVDVAKPEHEPESSNWIQVMPPTKQEVMDMLFNPVLWSGVLPTFKCTICGHCDPDKDEMILHVITHVPEKDRDELLEKLTKE